MNDLGFPLKDTQIEIAAAAAPRFLTPTLLRIKYPPSPNILSVYLVPLVPSQAPNHPGGGAQAQGRQGALSQAAATGPKKTGRD